MSYNTEEKTFYGGNLTPGHYNTETLVHYLTKSFVEIKPLTITTFNASSRLIIERTSGIESFTFNENLAELFHLNGSTNV